MKTNLIIDIRIASKYSGGALTYMRGMLNQILDHKEYEVFLIGTNENFLLIDDLNKNYKKIIPLSNSNKAYFRPLDNLFLYKKINEVKGKTVFWAPLNIGIPYFMNVDRVISTIHDLLVFDCPESVKFPNNVFRKIDLKRTIKMSDSIIAVSHFTQERIQLIYKDKLKGKTLIHSYEGVDLIPENLWDKCIESKIKSDNYLLFVGVGRKNKNLCFLLEVFSYLRKNLNYEGKLFIVGRVNSKLKSKLISQLEKLGITNQVVFLGFVSNNQLPYLYNKADAFIFPSYYEGFGLPAIEASAYGTKVCASNFNSLYEISKDFAMTANPFNIKDFAEKTIELINTEIIRKVDLQKFSWEKATNDLIKLIDNK